MHQRSDPARARALVLRYGWNATAYQIVNPGFAHWFSHDGDAVVGYVRRAGTRIVAGAPICAPDRLEDIARAFEHEAAAAGDRVCYFGAGERFETRWAAGGHRSAVRLGAQPSWDPSGWPAILATRPSLRAQLNRARNKGVVIEPWTTERATGAAPLRRCLEEWLAARPLPPLHFLVEPETLARLECRRVLVAERAGTPVAFLVASPVPARHGWLIEQIVRGRRAPNGTAELLIDAAMRTLAADGARYVTLGLAPLSRHGCADNRAAPLWLRGTLRWVRAHGRRFYNFEGLDRFKAKFQPHAWEDIVAIADAPRFPPRALWAIAAAFGEMSPVWLITRALARAVRQEVRWALAR